MPLPDRFSYTSGHVLTHLFALKVAQRDFTLDELRPFNGVDDKRILVGMSLQTRCAVVRISHEWVCLTVRFSCPAINGKVYEVTSKRNFYGPGMHHIRTSCWHRIGFG